MVAQWIECQTAVLQFWGSISAFPTMETISCEENQGCLEPATDVEALCRPGQRRRKTVQEAQSTNCSEISRRHQVVKHGKDGLSKCGRMRMDACADDDR